MEQPNYHSLRVLLVGSKGYAASSLRAVLNAAGIIRIAMAEDNRGALDLLCTENLMPCSSKPARCWMTCLSRWRRAGQMP